MNTIICEAIRLRKIIKFYYDGYERIVEPHTYGIHKDTGNEVLSAYQIGRYSSSLKPPEGVVGLNNYSPIFIDGLVSGFFEFLT